MSSDVQILYITKRIMIFLWIVPTQICGLGPRMISCRNQNVCAFGKFHFIKMTFSDIAGVAHQINNEKDDRKTLAGNNGITGYQITAVVFPNSELVSLLLSLHNFLSVIDVELKSIHFQQTMSNLLVALRQVFCSLSKGPLQSK